MVKFCLMASHGYPSGLIFQQEQGISRVIKDCQPILSTPGDRPEIIKSGPFNLKPLQSEEPWNPLSRFSESDRFVKFHSTSQRPVLTVMQDCRPDPVLGFGIAEQYARQEKIRQLLTSESNLVEEGLDLSFLSDLMVQQQPLAPPESGRSYFDAEGQPSLVYSSGEIHPQKPLLDLVGDLARDSRITVHPDGQLLFTGTRTEMKDILSIVAEFYLSKTSTNLRKQSVVPYFNRPKSRETRASNQLKIAEVAIPKSSENIKLKQSPKKNIKKAGRERDLYTRNYFHACETLLSLMIDKRQNCKTAILSLKKSGPEVPELLTQFSAGIAGTGLAVLLSVVCKIACGRVSFSASKLLSTGFGFGLVWLSWAVNKLRDTIVSINKNSSKFTLKEEEMLSRVDRSVNEIFFRAATLMAVAVLRLV